jgi:histidyl-tRNA synthetase
MAKLIEPRTLKGFRDYPPELALPRESLIDKARGVFRSYGFAPIDTPCLEYAEILLGKSDPSAEVQRQLYRFRDHGDRDVALRFDLTVPLARFAAQHVGPNPGQIPIPFKRYHIGTVWRGENPQAGRYREFMQCDFDCIGSPAHAADIEIALVMHDLLASLGFDHFEVRVNNRQVLNGLLEELRIADRAGPILIALDKLPKVGRAGVIDEMTGLGLPANTGERIVRLAETQGSNSQVLDRIAGEFGHHAKTADGIAKLRELLAVFAAVGIPEQRIRVDPSICRGLDYYTGTVFETFLTDLPAIGSVCSGGRYDNLAELYTKQRLPGVGASLGLDRLLAAMETLELLPKVSTPAPVLIVQFSAERLPDYQRMARKLRNSGIGVEVYPDAKKIGVQLQYAERKGCQAAVIAGPDEFAAGTCKLKDLFARSEQVVSIDQLPAAVKKLLDLRTL